MGYWFSHLDLYVTRREYSKHFDETHAYVCRRIGRNDDRADPSIWGKDKGPWSTLKSTPNSGSKLETTSYWSSKLK